MGIPWGTIIGGTLGSVIPGVGTTIGASVGGMFDAASSGSGTPAGGSSYEGVGPSGTWSVAPQYPWTEETNKAASGYVKGVFDNAASGEIPPWLKRALGVISTQQHSANDALYSALLSVWSCAYLRCSSIAERPMPP